MTKAKPGGWENPSGGETERRHCFRRGCRGGGAGGISPDSLVRAPAVLLPALLNRTGRRESCPLAAESSKAHPKALAQAQAFPRVWRSNPGALAPSLPISSRGVDETLCRKHWLCYSVLLLQMEKHHGISKHTNLPAFSFCFLIQNSCV